MVLSNQPTFPFTAWDNCRADEASTSKMLGDLIGQDFEDSAHLPILNPQYPQHQTETLTL